MRNLLCQHRREFELTADGCLEAEGVTCEVRFESPLQPEEQDRFENWLKEREIQWEVCVGDETTPTHVRFQHKLCGLIYFPHPDEVEDPKEAVCDPIQVNKLDSRWYAFEEDWN